LDFNIDI